MRRTTAALLATVLLAGAAVGCSSRGSSDEKPTPTPSMTSAAPSTPSVADQIAACTDALAAGKKQDSAECAGLDPDDLLTAIEGSNQRGRDALESAIASAAGQP